ncbi:cellulose biosynthesis cyclic di-GMP-binding regulatory protein BcsB [Shewanella surugensis]|uniref:Cyclic di-GMP-binding protein n=1 Tax=Shewanella surugensis TaxID=212020 RepID=A0ABT0L8E0_9GAMM|nr:cellulose biosynthesis cyclic di-GMP-binding regulatory protein BcsB [Shewanella surugensis]MCL1123640.1 cellulose biosynthesis cyclic di-GMP-binding regulatory protein BcsB [Shewanella surugensis]
MIANQFINRIILLTFLTASPCFASHQVMDGVTSYPIVIEQQLPFSDLGDSRSISLIGSESVAYINFGSRLDEVVSKVSLNLDFISSPALLSLVSHLKVFLNDELMGVIPIKEGEQGSRVRYTIPFEPRFLSDFNQIRFEFIGHIHHTCSDPNDPSIWTEISQTSTLRLQVQKNQLRSDLSLLPAPFFDRRDFNGLSLPIIMGDEYDLETVRAAGVLASYFGVLADWRSIDFPLLFNELPQQHSIVLMTNNNKPDFFQDFPDAEDAVVQMITHPTNPYVKLLLIVGKDSQDLMRAVQGLVLGEQLLTGAMATIDKLQQVQKRQPYDAPQWLNTNRRVAFSELVDNQLSLQVEGRNPPAVQVNLRLPADLFTWQSRGIPLALNYHYSPPLEDDSGSRMSLLINNQFIEAFNLTKRGEGADEQRIRVPLIEDALGYFDRINIPAFKVGSNNRIAFKFSFASLTGGKCQSIQPSKQFAAVDASSTIDFSGFPHYIEMPNLRAFANSGYPFTRMADLSDTVVILPTQASKAELQTFINMMGFMGQYAGYPSINVALKESWSAKTLADKDVLSIGIIPQLQQRLIEQDEANFVLKASSRLLKLPIKNEQKSDYQWTIRSEGKQAPIDVISVNAEGHFAAIAGVQSPFDRHRSVVSILAKTPTDFKLVTEALNDKGKIQYIYGSVVIFKSNELASYNVGEHYYLGELPIWTLVLYHFSHYPILLALLAVLLVMIITIVLWRILRVVNKRRLAIKEADG